MNKQPPKSDSHLSDSQAIAAATRALARRADMTLVWGSNEESPPPLHAKKTVQLPRFCTTEQGLRGARGEADLAALVLRYHSKRKHAQGRPSNLKAAVIFDALEQVRVEQLGAAYMAGAKHNIASRNADWLESQGYAMFPDAADPPIAHMLAALLRERMDGTPIPNALEKTVERHRASVEAQGAAALDALAKGSLTQAEFAQGIYDLLQDLGIDEGTRGDGKGERKDGKTQPENGQEESDDAINTDSEQVDAQQKKDPEGTEQKKDDAGQQQRPATPEELQNAAGEEESDQNEADADNEPPAFGEAFKSDFYRVFTREHDQTVMADELADEEELQRLRTQLDQKLLQFHGVTSRLSSRLQRLLMAQRMRHWEFEQEEGMIDAARLTQVVISPDYPYYYKRERDTEFRDTVVTLLLDNSGSMRGRPITVAALSADILARTLERCGVK
ncbi:MAG: cobaltochelatase subunit CobT, partial [Alphaproteobacteria bacterium]|nr:cobaltochelatase subunit CobT [Alphaproteobacteria bacterium]